MKAVLLILALQAAMVPITYAAARCDDVAIVNMANASNEVELALRKQVIEAGDAGGRYFFIQRGTQLVPIAILDRSIAKTTSLAAQTSSIVSTLKGLVYNPLYRMPSILSLAAMGITGAQLAQAVADAPVNTLAAAAVSVGTGLLWRTWARLSTPVGQKYFSFAANRILKAFGRELPKYGEVPFFVMTGDIKASDANLEVGKVLERNGFGDARQIDSKRFIELLNTVASEKPDFVFEQSLTVQTHLRSAQTGITIQSGDQNFHGSSSKLLFLSAFGISLNNPMLHLDQGDRIDIIYLRDRDLNAQTQEGDFPVGFMIENAAGQSRLYFPTVGDAESKRLLRNLYLIAIGKKSLVDADFDQSKVGSKSAFVFIGKKIEETTQKTAAAIAERLKAFNQDLKGEDDFLSEQSINNLLLETATRGDIDEPNKASGMRDVP